MPNRNSSKMDLISPIYGGGNFYPNEAPARRLEFTSFINIRPRDGNSSMEVGDEELQIEITKLCSKLLLDPYDTLA
ncbi:MAG: hypothetical protein ISR87_11255 [Candidatus Marinimicrobia bacterium]|nr:hypothetical protein [Candidatus Neomarinimicrobiota bacterium]